jgi:hypothetical protein
MPHRMGCESISSKGVLAIAEALKENDTLEKLS